MQNFILRCTKEELDMLGAVLDTFIKATGLQGNEIAQKTLTLLKSVKLENIEAAE
jgi:hypothetical protein